MFRFIAIDKDSTATIITCEDTHEFSFYRSMSRCVGDQGELCSTKLPTNYMLMYDDAYGWDKADEDFKNDINECASAITGHTMYNTCVLCKVNNNDSNCNSEFETIYDDDISFLKECLAEIYKDIQWRE